MMDYEMILQEARGKLQGACRVCRVCDGVACRGEVPGMGGKGTGSSFIENVRALERVRLNMDAIHDCSDPDTTVSLFGKMLTLPILAAPIAGTQTDLGGALDEYTYVESVVRGCRLGGGLAMTGSGHDMDILDANISAIRDNRGHGVVMIKPMKDELILRSIRAAEEAGALAVGIDIDACGLPHPTGNAGAFEPKTQEQIWKLKQSTHLPLVIKGIMTARAAKKAVEAGASAIVVSNHGGRVLDGCPGTAEVLPRIAEAVRRRIPVLVDGGVRTGVDVLKMIALGADAVMIGRPFVIAAFGGGAEGVQMYLRQLEQELRSSLMLTGCDTLDEVGTNGVVYKI